MGDEPDVADGLEGHLLWPAAIDVVIPGTNETKQIVLPRHTRLRITVDPDWPQDVAEFDKVEAGIFGECVRRNAIPPELKHLVDGQDSP